MRIASLVPEGIVNAIYRSLIPMQALAHRGHTVHVEERNELRDARPLLDFDVVHFVRFCHPPMERLARHLKASGVPIVWDNDDDLLAAPRGNPNYRERRGLVGRDIARAMTTMMRLADVVTTPSAALAASYRERSGCDARVLENCLPPTFQPLGRRGDGDRVTVGWVAGAEHQRDVERLRLRELLEALLAQHEHVAVTSIGVNLGLRSERYQHAANVPYGKLPQAIGTFDVAIAPLADIPFNRGRSNVKLKEYAAVGVPWLASPIGPYAGMGEQHGGRLVADDDWADALSTLVTDRAARAQLARRGMTWAREQTIEHHVEGWERAFEDAVAHARAPV
ncbi:MAG TPA: glycosyltransferase [Conexibacter sp.]|nr:glycosyltransferase [Conexibacter sp.]